jgi:hypothetical protein
MPEQRPDVPDQADDRFANGVGEFLASNPLTLMALGGGIAQGGIGRGLQLAVPAAQAERKEAKQEQLQGITYSALKSAGVPHGQALAGALNPEILKTIARAHFEARPSFETIGYEHGQTSFGFVDPTRMPVTPYNKPDTGLLASNFDPRSAGGNETASKQISSLNNLVARLGNVIDASDARQLARARGPLADEMAKLLRSNGMSEKEIEAWKDKLLGASSRAELGAAVGGSADLINDRLAALKEQHQRVTGRPAPEWLPPRSRAALERVRRWAQEQGPQ